MHTSLLFAILCAFALIGCQSDVARRSQIENERLEFLNNAQNVSGLEKSNEFHRAMHDEIDRSIHTLQLKSLRKPYFIEYSLRDRKFYSVDASFGSLVESGASSGKSLIVGVRVGDSLFDNTNFFDVDLGFFGSTDDEERYRNRQVPIELDYWALRRELWLATDAAYKQSAELFAKKQAAIKNRLRLDTIQDFTTVGSQQYVDTVAFPPFDRAKFEKMCVAVSAVFREFPAINLSKVGVEYLPEHVYYYNSSGNGFIKTKLYTGLEIVAATQAHDGMPVANAYAAYSMDPANLPSTDSLIRAARILAQNLTALTKAPTITPYSGPVLFEGQAAAETFAQSFLPNTVTQRVPITESGIQDEPRYFAFQNKIGGRVLPEFLSMDVMPKTRSFNGTPLISAYTVDDEGVPAQDFTIVNGGYLKGLMSSRIPTRRIKSSNGHYRGGAAIMSVLGLEADDAHTFSNTQLREKLIALCKDRELPYGIIVRKALNKNILFTTLFGLTQGEYPFTRGVTSISLLEAYKIFPDGREELIRGCEVAGITHQSFKDIIGIGDRRFAYNYLASAVTSPFVTGGSQFLPVSIIAADVLFEDLEIRTVQEDFTKPPALEHPFFSDSK